MTKTSFTERFCLAAGALDTVTGVLLVASPAITLRLLGIAPPSPEAQTYLRFVGVFVGAVGVSYLYPLILSASLRLGRLAVVLEVTALVRLAVALFLGTCIAVGVLPLAWATVMLTDLTVAVAQLFLRGGLQ